MSVEGRKAAPNIQVGAYIENERDEITKQYGKDCIGRSKIVNGQKVKIPPKFRLFFGDDKEKIETYIRRGYAPVKDSDGEIVTHRGDPLFKIHNDAWQGRMDASARRHNDQAQGVMETSVDGHKISEMSAPGE